MTQDEQFALLNRARAVLICMAIDDALPEAKSSARLKSVDYKTVPLEVERPAA